MTLRLPDDLMHPTVFPHPADNIDCIETHASWVILAGDYAYKIKKPVNFGFLDFSTLEKRRDACEEELRINQRTAPMLYEALVGIRENPAAITQDNIGAVEYAIRMRRFPQFALLSTVLQNTPDALALTDHLAGHVAGFHAGAGVAPPHSPYGTPESVLAPVQDNFRQLDELIDTPALTQTLRATEEWTRQAFMQLKSDFARRRQDGHVRECHGDMHLGNIVVLDGNPVLFDALEFNASLRWIDVISDVAFLVMDLQMSGRPDLGWHFLNRWLEHSGDYAGLKLLPWYLCYRAMVRAKVAALRLAQVEGDARNAVQAQCQSYLELAARYTRPRERALVITHGISGSGKTRHSQVVTDQCGLIRIRADVERKRLFGLMATESSRHIPGGIYTEEANHRTQRHLEQQARMVLQAGFPVLVDATFIRHAPRESMRAVASSMQVPWFVLAFEAAPDLLRERAERRAAKAQDASEAGAEIVNHQLASLEPLTPEERQHSLAIATDTSPDWSRLLPTFFAQTRLRSIFD